MKNFPSINIPQLITCSLLLLLLSCLTLLQAEEYASEASDLSLEIELVTVNNPGNKPDSTGFGAVPYTFSIGAYDITAAQYCEFLNAVARHSDPYGLYHRGMSYDPAVACIDRKGISGDFFYQPKRGCEQWPITNVSLYTAARFCNWLQLGKPCGDEGVSTTDSGAYDLWGEHHGALIRNRHAIYFIPNEDEWYKAAYYNSQGKYYYPFPTRSYWQPHTQHNERSLYNNEANYAGSGVTPVGMFATTMSPYGAFDMGGNVFQWTESRNKNNRLLYKIRGGSWNSSSNYFFATNDLDKSTENSAGATKESNKIGFRIGKVGGVSLRENHLSTTPDQLWLTPEHTAILSGIGLFTGAVAFCPEMLGALGLACSEKIASCFKPGKELTPTDVVNLVPSTTDRVEARDMQDSDEKRIQKESEKGYEAHSLSQEIRAEPYTYTVNDPIRVVGIPVEISMVAFKELVSTELQDPNKLENVLSYDQQNVQFSFIPNRLTLNKNVRTTNDQFYQLLTSDLQGNIILDNSLFPDFQRFFFSSDQSQPITLSRIKEALNGIDSAKVATQSQSSSAITESQLKGWLTYVTKERDERKALWEKLKGELWWKQVRGNASQTLCCLGTTCCVITSAILFHRMATAETSSTSASNNRRRDHHGSSSRGGPPVIVITSIMAPAHPSSSNNHSACRGGSNPFNGYTSQAASSSASGGAPDNTPVGTPSSPVSETLQERCDKAEIKYREAKNFCMKLQEKLDSIPSAPPLNEEC